MLMLPSLAGAFCFEEAGRLYGVNPRLLQGIASVESDLNPAAINRNRNGSFDLGLMQINSFWLKSLGTSAQDLIDKPCYNVKVGAWILSGCLNRHGENWQAIGCYNAAGHDKQVNYSWKIYRELLKGTTTAAGKDRPASTAALAGRLRTPPSQGDAQADRGFDGAEKSTAVPAVSSINVSITEKE